MASTTLADYLVNYLADLGVEYVFVVTGAAIAGVLDSFTRTDRIKDIAVAHEQAGSFASETYTKISGKLGVAMATSGPGGINLLTGIANCWYDSIPNLFITGQINSKFVNHNPLIRQVGFQENDIVAMAKKITKWAYVIENTEEIRQVLEKAVHIATTGRPGPVLIDIPMDLQNHTVDPDKLQPYQKEVVQCDDIPSIQHKIFTLLDALNEAERPVLLVGGGVRLASATELIRELCCELKIPVFPTWNSLDIITSDFPYYCGRVGTYGGPGRNFGIQNADLLLSIGSRISGRITGGITTSFARMARKVIVDIDGAMTDPAIQQVAGDINIQCDAKLFIKMLLDSLAGRKLKSFVPWLDTAREWLKYDPVLPQYYQEAGRVNPYVFINELSHLLGPSDIIIGDCGGNVVVTCQAFKTKFGQRLCSSHGNSPMGYSMAGAIGAYFARPDSRIICLIGDGGFTMNVQELQTIKHYKIPIKTFIFNNSVYGIIKSFQETNLGGRFEVSGPHGYCPPDFSRVTEAYGIKAITLDDQNDIKSRIIFALEYPEAIVCDVKMDEYYRYEPRIFGWNTPIEDMYPYLPRDEFRKNMFIEPMSGWETPIMPYK